MTKTIHFSMSLAIICLVLNTHRAHSMHQLRSLLLRPMLQILTTQTRWTSSKNQDPHHSSATYQQHLKNLHTFLPQPIAGQNPTLYEKVKNSHPNNTNHHIITSLLMTSVEQTSELSEMSRALHYFIMTQAPHFQAPTLTISPFAKNPSYDPNLACIKFPNNYHSLSPAVLYAFLLHEYRHYLHDQTGLFSTIPTNTALKLYPHQVQAAAQQHGCVTFQPDEADYFQINEYDADLFATQHISCPICLKIVQIKLENILNHSGYFSFQDFQQHVKQAQHNPTCPAHTDTPGDEKHNRVVKKLTKELTMILEFRCCKQTTSYSKKYLKLLSQIEKLDRKSGSLTQHIPGYSQSIFNAYLQWMDQKKTLAQNMLALRKQQEIISLLPKPN